jgi:hypothetical protein
MDYVTITLVLDQLIPAPRSTREASAQGSLRYATPDFLLRLVALASFVRLSLMKAAYVVVSGAAWQEIRVRSVEKHFHERSAELQIPRLRSG